MSFKSLDADDFVISSDSISATLFSGGEPTLTTFFTSSTQEAGSSGDYYLNIYQTASTEDSAAVQFAIAYGNSEGSGSKVYNDNVDGKSPTSTIYGQYQNLVIGDENTNFTFGNITSSEFYALSIDRARYKEKLFLESLTLKVSSSTGELSITDNSAYVTSVQFNEAGRVFQLVSGSRGIKNESVNSDGYTDSSGSYGWLLPDIGTILINPHALATSAADGGIAFEYSGSESGSSAPAVSPNSDLFQAIELGEEFRLNSEETITSDFVFIRPRSSEFNYSENPSFISGSTGEVLYNNFINNPQTFITTVGMYNDSNELLAVAKLSRPLLKDFTKEALIRVKLDF